MTGPVSVPIKYHLTTYDLERIEHREELLKGLEQIHYIAHKVRIGLSQDWADAILEIEEIAERVLYKEREQ